MELSGWKEVHQADGRGNHLVLSGDIWFSTTHVRIKYAAIKNTIGVDSLLPYLTREVNEGSVILPAVAEGGNRVERWSILVLP